MISDGGDMVVARHGQGDVGLGEQVAERPGIVDGEPLPRISGILLREVSEVVVGNNDLPCRRLVVEDLPQPLASGRPDGAAPGLTLFHPGRCGGVQSD